MSHQLPGAVTDQRVIPVARGQDPTTAPPLAKALAEGGLTVLEITVEGDGGIEAIASLAGGPMVVGAGTVTSIGQAEAAIAAGAVFLVSPHLDLDLLDWVSSKGVPFVPGVLSPNEINAALVAGATTMKLFPASLGGPGLVETLLAVYPGLSVIPTGGVDDSNAAAYLEAGAMAVGVGGWLTGVDDLDVVRKRAAILASLSR